MPARRFNVGVKTFLEAHDPLVKAQNFACGWMSLRQVFRAIDSFVPSGSVHFFAEVL